MPARWPGARPCWAALITQAGARAGCGVTDYSPAIVAALDALFGRRALRACCITDVMP